MFTAGAKHLEAAAAAAAATTTIAAAASAVIAVFSLINRAISRILKLGRGELSYPHI